MNILEVFLKQKNKLIIVLSSLDLQLINEISKNLENEGKEVIKFGFGQSPFNIPDTIVDELKKNAFQKSYLPIQGLQQLREAIANFESKKKKKHLIQNK